MTPPQVLASLRARGVALAAAGDRLRIRPAGVLTDADREVLTAMKPALLRLLGDSSPDLQAPPGGACTICGGADVVAWGSDGEAWCRACWMAQVGSRVDRPQPTPTLAEVHAELTDAERRRLGAEAAAGDPLADLVLDAVACTPEPAAWRLYSRRLDREVWVARDAEAAAALDADGAQAGLPVVLADDLEHLRDFGDRRLNDLLDALVHFPGARIVELDPEAAS